MRRNPLGLFLASVLSLGAFFSADLPVSAKGPDFTRKEDVVYGRKYGTALTMDVFIPKDMTIIADWFDQHIGKKSGQ